MLRIFLTALHLGLIFLLAEAMRYTGQFILTPANVSYLRQEGVGCVEMLLVAPNRQATLMVTRFSKMKINLLDPRDKDLSVGLVRSSLSFYG